MQGTQVRSLAGELEARSPQLESSGTTVKTPLSQKKRLKKNKKKTGWKISSSPERSHEEIQLQRKNYGYGQKCVKKRINFKDREKTTDHGKLAKEITVYIHTAEY